MKVNESKNKKGFINKLFIKLCRKLGYEIIDQNNLYIPTINKFANQGLSISQKYSISIRQHKLIKVK